MTRLSLIEDALRLQQNQPNGSGTTEHDHREFFSDADHWLLTTSRADYSVLKTFLAQAAWEEADRETQRLMLQIAGTEAQGLGFLSAEQIDEFPCLDLKTHQ